MTIRSLILLPVALLAGIALKAQQTPASADEVLKEAFSQAGRQNKNVFVIFHASWCGWCHRMDTSMNDPSVKAYFDKNYVVRHLTVMEAKDKKALENPGAQELLVKYHGDKQGIPFWLVFDKNGKLLGDSQIRPAGAGFDTPGQNVGCPPKDDELAHFVQLLKKTSRLSTEQQAAVEKRFLQNQR